MMSNSPILSVIVPVYNTAPWLRRCLDSICTQSYRNLEILCVNDGSTDNSAEILAEYAARDARIKVLTQANAGLSAARNTALEHATGEWVAGVDSDDFLFPGIYEQAMQCIAPDVDIVFFGVQDVDETGGHLPHQAYFNLPASGVYSMNPELAKRLNVCFWSKLWRRSMIEKNALRFPVGLVHEDEAMYYMAAPQIRQIAICPAMGYAYMQRAGSIMNAAGIDCIKKINRYIQVLEFTHGEYHRRGWLQTSAKSYLYIMFFQICTRWYQQCPRESRAEVFSLLGAIIHRCHMCDDYRLERFIPHEQKGLLSITRKAQCKIWRLSGIPIWIDFYTSNGNKITPALLWRHLCSKLRHLTCRG